MKRLDIHDQHDFFEYVTLEDSVPARERNRIDVAVLDMNHAFPNIGHDALVHVVLDAAWTLRTDLARAGSKIRVLSFDVRGASLVPEPGRFAIHIGTGGPGHLDPRLNDGVHEWSQGVVDSTEWEAPLFRLFDAIVNDPDAALLAVCHSFGLVCRWAGIASPALRAEKSSGMRLNRLSREAMQHPWFEQFGHELADHQHFRVIDNRLFDLMLEDAGKCTPVAFEAAGNSALTMIELARDREGMMPRFLGMNHHPEVIDREHMMQVLEEKRAHGEVSDRWYEERATTMDELFDTERERQSRLTSHFTLLEPLRFHLRRAVERMA